MSKYDFELLIMLTDSLKELIYLVPFLLFKGKFEIVFNFWV